MDQLKKAALQLKEKIENKSPLEKALGEATSDVNWNASNKLLQEIADHTYSFGDFAEVMKYIWRKISSERKQWRRILKTLNLIEYLIKNGSPRCIQEFRDEIYQIRTLQDFAHYEDGQDRGAGIRETSKRVVQLLNDEAKIDEERKKAQEIRERLGDMRGIGSGGERTGGYGGYSGSGSGSHGGSTSSYGGTGSGSYGGSGSNVPKYGGYSNKDSGMGPSKSGSGYDDTRKVGSWRVDKSTAEESNKHKDDHHDSHTAKSGTKFEADFTEKKTDTNKQVPTLAGPGQTKKFAPPKGMKGNTTTTTSAQDVNLFDDITSAPSTNNNAQVQGNMFDWSAPTQNQPQTQAPVQQANNNEWAWNAPTGNPTPQQTNTGTNKTQGDPFGWGEPQTSAPVQSNTNITNLYQQQPQTQAPPFGFNSTPAQNTNNLANQFGGLSFNSTPSQPTTGFNAFGTPQQSAQVQNFNANPSPQKTDLFDDFQTAKPGTNDYKNYSNAEKSIIDLSDLAGEANKKKDKDNKINQNKNSNDGFLYSTQSDLDSFFVAGQQNAGMNMGGFNQGGMGMQQGNMGGFNQGGMGHGMGGGMNMGGMGGMGMQQGNMGGYGQMGGFNQGGMGMQQGNMGGFNNMGGMQGGFGNQNMNQMGGMNQGYGGFR